METIPPAVELITISILMLLFAVGYHYWNDTRKFDWFKGGMLIMSLMAAIGAVLYSINA